jgi:hypothetical protein
MLLASHPLGPTAKASLPAARWGTGRQISYGDRRLGSPVTDWRRRVGQGNSRRAVAAVQRRRGRGNPHGSEDRDPAQPHVAREASMWPREGARQVPGLGGSVEGRARRWRSGGGRGNLGSGDRATRLDRQVTRGAFVVHK